MSSIRQTAVVRFCGGLTIALFAAALTKAAESPSTVVAKQGKAIVTLADIDAFADGIPKEQRPGFFNDPTRIENLIGALLLKKQLAAEARETGLDRDPAVQGQIALATDDALSKARTQRFKAELKIPNFDELAKEDYIGHKEKYVVPGKLDVKHVLISTKTRSSEEAKALAATVEKEARAHPDQFDALVEKYSEDPSKEANKGLMQEAGSNRYMPAFSEAARALKKAGDISPVIETKYGFHVLKLVERTPDKQQTFADVREKIVERLRNEYVDKTVRAHTDGLRNQPIDATPELVASLRSRYGTQEAPAAPAAAGH